MTLLVAQAFGQDSAGELSPHFGTDAHYAGYFHGNHGYIIKTKESRLGSQLKDNQFVVEVRSASERSLKIIRRPADGHIAVLEAGDPKANNLKTGAVKFQAPVDGSKVSSAWSRATNPDAFRAKTKTGKKRSWIYVDSDVLDEQTDRFFVGVGVQTDAETKLQIAELLVVTEKSFLLYLDPDNNRFSTVAIDLFRRPIGEKDYQPMTPGSMAASVWKKLKPSQPPEAPDLNSLSDTAYGKFKADFQNEFAKHPQATAKKAKQILIGLLNLEQTPNSHSVFEVDADFTIQSLLSLVATANKIKIGEKELEKFKLGSTRAREKLDLDIHKKYLDVFTAMVLLEQGKL